MAFKLDARTISLMAVMTAVVFVFTRAISIPVANGYLNFSDIAIFFAAFAFGPWVGLVAGGLGASLADLSLGYSQFAPFTFIAHGGEGLLAGYLAFKLAGNARYIWGWLAGAVAMVAVYFLAEALIEPLGGMVQALSDFPVNIIQVVAGGLVGYALLFAVRRAYPQIDRFNKS
ncbi:MAG: ECF transporter S component [Chloroflexi bacterium]|nr:ECF transporter S component [Chloroflexota bacterium]